MDSKSGIMAEQKLASCLSSTNYTKEAPSGRTFQAIFSGYDNKNMKQWIATLRKHLDQELNEPFL